VGRGGRVQLPRSPGSSRVRADYDNAVPQLGKAFISRLSGAGGNYYGPSTACSHDVREEVVTMASRHSGEGQEPGGRGPGPAPARPGGCAPRSTPGYRRRDRLPGGPLAGQPHRQRLFAGPELRHEQLRIVLGYVSDRRFCRPGVFNDLLRQMAPAGARPGEEPNASAGWPGIPVLRWTKVVGIVWSA